MSIYSNYITENIFLDNNDELLNKYLDECFLTESSTSKGINDLTNRIKVLTRKIENEELTEDEIKEEIQDIYDQAQYILKGAMSNNSTTILAILSLISAIVAYIFIIVEFFPISVLLSGGISLLTSICSIISLSKSEYDKFYTILVRAESNIMKELRIAKEENDEKKIKSCERVIKIYEELKSKRRTELNQRAHDQYYAAQKESSDILLEYMGDEIKTNNMIQTFNDIDHYLKYEMEILNVYVDHVENMMSMANSATKKNVSDITKKCVDEGNKINEDVDKVRDTWMPMSISMFNKQIKLFSNKYSKLGIEQREKFSKKIEKYIDQINDIASKYDKNSDIGKRINEVSEKVKSMDYANGEKIISLIYDWNNNGIIYQCNEIIRICAYLIKELNIKGIKSSLVYKIASKFGK